MLDRVMNTWTSAERREGVELSRAAQKQWWHLEKQAVRKSHAVCWPPQRRRPKSCLGWTISLEWTLPEMPTSLKQNWVKCTACKLKSAKGDEMIVINISSIKRECGNYSVTFFRFTAELWHNKTFAIFKNEPVYSGTYRWRTSGTSGTF